MTLRESVQELLDFQKTNPPVEQIYERFYDENIVVQENLQAPRVGRAISIDRQQRMNAKCTEHLLNHEVYVEVFGAGAPRSIPSVLRSSSIFSQWMPYPPPHTSHCVLWSGALSTVVSEVLWH